MKKTILDNINNHKFDDWAKGLMDRDPVLDEWQIEQIKVDKVHGPYREEYRNLPIKENGESLVSCACHGLVSKDYYFLKLADGDLSFLPALEQRLFYPFAWLRESIVHSLKKVDQLLREHDLFLVVVSGWRHPETQQLAIEWSRKQHGVEETQRRYAELFLTEEGRLLAPHATGGVCDLELWSLQSGKPLSRMDPGDEINFFVLEQRKDLSEEEHVKRDVRRILYHVLCTPGVCLFEEEVFTIHPGEFWHFGCGDPLSAFFRRESYAVYGPTEPPKGYSMYSY